MENWENVDIFTIPRQDNLTFPNMTKCFDACFKDEKSTISTLWISAEIVDIVDKSFPEKLFPYFIYVSGPHGYQQISGLKIF